MGTAFLFALVEIIIQHRFHVERAVAGSHGEYAHILFDDHEILVFVNDFHIPADQQVRCAFALAHRHLVSRFQRKVELCRTLAVALDPFALECGLDFAVADAFEVGQEKLQEWLLLADIQIMVIFRMVFS